MKVDRLAGMLVILLEKDARRRASMESEVP